jgi:nitronate monooxygenase
VEALRMGYAGVQMGTRFIATTECSASPEYKQTIVDAEEEDIVHSERLTGVPVAVINTPSVQKLGLKAGPLARWMLRGRRTKHWMRTIYALKSFWQLRRSLHAKSARGDYWQAGKSVAGIRSVEPVATIVGRFAEAARSAGLARPGETRHEGRPIRRSEGGPD